MLSRFLRTPNADVSVDAAPLIFGFNFVKNCAAYTWTFTVFYIRNMEEWPCVGWKCVTTIHDAKAVANKKVILYNLSHVLWTQSAEQWWELSHKQHLAVNSSASVFPLHPWWLSFSLLTLKANFWKKDFVAWKLVLNYFVWIRQWSIIF